MESGQYYMFYYCMCIDTALLLSLLFYLQHCFCSRCYQRSFIAEYLTGAFLIFIMTTSYPKVNYFIVCPQCITKIPKTQNAYQISSWNGHRCAQTVLLARNAGTEIYFRIRDRTSSVTSAHSSLEQDLWTLEMDGKLNVFKIIAGHRNAELDTFDNVGSYFMWKFHGWLKCVCSLCRNECAATGRTCCGTERHDWQRNKCVAHYSLRDTPGCYIFNVVERSGGMGNVRHQLVLCKFLHRCQYKMSCPKYHSFIERDFAFVRRHCPTLTIEEVCRKLNNLNVTLTSTDFRFALLCKWCQLLGLHEIKNGTTEFCSRGHQWKFTVCPAVFEVQTGRWIFIKRLPRNLPKDASRLVMCRDMAKNGSCRFNNQCQFAHSQLEKDVWSWQMTSQPRGLTYLL